MSSTDEIKADIVATRAELAETADALAAKVNEKARAVRRMVMTVAGATTAVAVLLAVIRQVRK